MARAASARLLAFAALAAVVAGEPMVRRRRGAGRRARRATRPGPQPTPLLSPQCDAVSRLPPTADRCAYAKAHCEQSEGGWGEGGRRGPGERPARADAASPLPPASFIPYMAAYYCLAAPAGAVTCALALAAASILLLAFFAALSATAEDYFSPGLQSLALALNLPPRLAGATLLALGNGAPDIAAAAAAVRAGSVDLAHGALLGAGLFVGCIVAGAVLRAVGGAPARGALARDVGGYGVAALAVALLLRAGATGPGAGAALFGLYAVYVLAVAGADATRVVADARAAAAAEPLLGPPPEADLPPGIGPYAGRRAARARTDELEMTLSDMGATLSADGARAATPAAPRDPALPAVLVVGVEGGDQDTSPLVAALERHAAWAASAAAFLDAPLAAARAATIPVVEGDGTAWLPLAVALGPPAAGAYLAAPWPAVAAVSCLSVPAGLAAGATRLPAFTDAADWVSPRTLAAGRAAAAALGFAAAALWVDAVASELVSLLRLVGIVARIPPAVLGGTLLAWGNSVGDLATNVAVARRGLPNMALTACYAGPLTNLLVGLGAGLVRGEGGASGGGGGPSSSRLSAGGAVATVAVLAMVALLAATATACGRRLPSSTAWALLGVYGAYVVAAVALSGGG